jgi:ribonuclease T2
MTWIVHGLWPQHKKGYPADCKVESFMVDDIDKEKIKRFMPSDYLITHEWEKHGTCSGLSRSKYYALTELLWDGLKLPDLKAGEYSPAEVRQMVIDSNPALLPNMIELACDDNGSKPNSSDDTLDEIRICYSKDGQFMSCTEREKSCDVIDSVEVRSID